MTDEQFASRRSLRESDKAGDPVHPQPVVAQIATTGVVNPYAPQISTTGVVNPYIPAAPVAPVAQAVPIAAAPAAPVIPPAPAVTTPTSAVEPVAPLSEITAPVSELRPREPVLAEAEEAITTEFPIFSVSPNLTLEPQTASIIIDNFQPIEHSAIVISETGEMLKTGSISLPNLSTNTGEISTILDAEMVDEATALDSVTGYVSTIAPIRASGVVNSSGKIGIMPAKRSRGEGGGYTALTISIVSVTIGGLVIGAFMLGILK
jgi:hypothetical protein